MRVRLEVQAGGNALAANFRAQDAHVRRAAQNLVRRRGPSHYRRVYENTPVQSGFMRDHLRYEPSPQDFTYRVGWAREDFDEAGFYPYYRVVLFGSRTVPGFDYFSPIADDEATEFRRELRGILRSGPLGTSNRGRAA